MIGLVIGWSWRPRWTGLLYLGHCSKLRLTWTAPPGFGAWRFWLAFTAFSDESVLIWFSGKEEKHLKLSHMSKIISRQRTSWKALIVPTFLKEKSNLFTKTKACKDATLVVANLQRQQVRGSRHCFTLWWNVEVVYTSSKCSKGYVLK
ncbi:hypothetical protein CsSME_00002515 [Camellia sinensis var. sinensis]